MTTYTTTADSSGNYSIAFGTAYTGGQKVSVTSEKDGSTKNIELYAPSSVTGGGAIQFSGNMTDFPINIGVITLTDQISGTIGTYAMYANNTNNMFAKATGLVIQGGVTNIQAYAFSNWYYSNVLTLPATLTTIGNYAFQEFGSSSTTVFSVTLPNSVTSLGTYCFNYAGFTNFDIGTGVTTIPSYAFSYTSKLETFNYRNATGVSGSAFYGSNLKYNIIPNTVTTLGSGAYQNAKSVEIDTGNGITVITTYAFSGSSSCLKFTIGSSVTSIGSNGMAGLTACTEMICLPTTPPTLDSSGLTNLKSTCVIKVPSASLTAYKTATNWSAHASKMVGV